MHGQLAALIVVSVSAGASPVYKCQEKGAITTYSDRPCSADAAPLALGDAIVTAPPSRSERALAEAWDRREAGQATARDRDDAEWLKQHGQRRDREARVGKAVVEHRVIKGMTTAEVRSALGEPDQVAGGDSFGTAKETWTYRDGTATRTVNFKDGEVISASGRSKSAKARARKKS